MASPGQFCIAWLMVTLLVSICHGIVERDGYWREYPFIKKASDYQSASSSSTRPDETYYDYIVVGGGTAGCPLAATLSHNFSVLVLERGGVPFNNANVSFLKNFHISLADTSSTSASQFFMSTDGVFNARARVLGGGSSINAGFYTRAGKEFIVKSGWNEELVESSYQWVEEKIVHKPVLVPWQDALKNALLREGVQPFNGFTYDHKFGTKLGGTIFDRFGRRHTAAELLRFGNSEQLSVYIHATVQKILFDTSGQKPKAVGVVFKDGNGIQHQAFISSSPTSEVILSSGAIGTSQLLILSGIGPKSELAKFNIPAVLENENVGEGLIDNPMNTIFLPTKKPIEQSLIQVVGITKHGVYIEGSSGFGMSNTSIQYHQAVMKRQDIPYEAFKGGFLLEKIAKPLSTGYLRLTSHKVDENPSVTFNYFSHPKDLKRCVKGIQIMAKLLLSKSYDKLTMWDGMTRERMLNISMSENVNLKPKHGNDTMSLEQYCKDTVITIWHYHGGARVRKVVSDDFRVIGIDRLRIVDGSVFDESPGTNPQATVMMMGRYMGIEILKSRLVRDH